jgi:hypothetical protein
MSPCTAKKFANQTAHVRMVINDDDSKTAKKRGETYRVGFFVNVRLKSSKRRLYLIACSIRTKLFHELVVKAEDQKCWRPLSYEQRYVLPPEKFEH